MDLRQPRRPCARPQAASGAAIGRGALDTWLAVAGAYRTWAKHNPTAFALVYSSSIPGYQGTPETTGAASRVGQSLLSVMADLVDEGQVDLDTIATETDDLLTVQLDDAP